MTESPAAEPGRDGVAEQVGGVSLAQYARVVRECADWQPYQQAALRAAARHGIDAEVWRAAAAAWQRRIEREPAVAAAYALTYLRSAD